MINLLMRFYELNGGTIRIDGIEPARCHAKTYGRLRVWSYKNTWLFNGTIRDNLAYGKSGATEEEIIAAAKTAHADHFIRTLPDGMIRS
ncbi:hypothetical protein [Exiguobacterium acetylicum]|uniref:hypothetical protein n=1 Tax=Exiguobacterium acetylicum TaxID=41170 RepID=UPI000ABE1626